MAAVSEAAKQKHDEQMRVFFLRNPDYRHSYMERWFWRCDCGGESNLVWDGDMDAYRAAVRHAYRCGKGITTVLALSLNPRFKSNPRT
jgi:hypothetical protein